MAKTTKSESVKTATELRAEADRAVAAWRACPRKHIEVMHARDVRTTQEDLDRILASIEKRELETAENDAFVTALEALRAAEIAEGNDLAKRAEPEYMLAAIRARMQEEAALEAQLKTLRAGHREFVKALRKPFEELWQYRLKRGEPTAAPDTLPQAHADSLSSHVSAIETYRRPRRDSSAKGVLVYLRDEEVKVRARLERELRRKEEDESIAATRARERVVYIDPDARASMPTYQDQKLAEAHRARSKP